MLHVLKFSSEDCGTCHRMSHYDATVCDELGCTFVSVMLQDTEAGRPLEIDALLSAVCEVGRRLAMPTPHLDSLLGMTRLMARTRGLYPEAGPAGETVW